MFLCTGVIGFAVPTPLAAGLLTAAELLAAAEPLSLFLFRTWLVSAMRYSDSISNCSRWIGDSGSFADFPTGSLEVGWELVEVSFS